MPYASLTGIVGNQQVAPFQLPDTTARMQPGLTDWFVDNYWGAGEFAYLRAGGTIRQYGICNIEPTLQTTGWRFDATECPNTANLGETVAIAQTAMTVGQFGWFCIGGITPVNCTADVAADTAFGLAAAGQGGANAAGKQIINARIMAPSTTTVAKATTGAVGGKVLTVSSADGWFLGVYLSGTGVAAATVVTGIDPSGTQITINNALTGAYVNGTVTGTYNNATVFYNVAYVNRPFAQGPIT